uniref:Putative secreted protein n=1 Tax=Anopheles darlingi TaxID=43151 RepID=A0A2M4CKS3_ANODA
MKFSFALVLLGLLATVVFANALPTPQEEGADPTDPTVEISAEVDPDNLIAAVLSEAMAKGGRRIDWDKVVAGAKLMYAGFTA